MTYVLSIDWLTIFCVYMGPDEWTPVESDKYAYKCEPFGTRCFSRLYRVRMANNEGGWDEFAEVQATPYSSILPSYAIMVRFTNRTLYLPEFWELADNFLQVNLFACNSISRIDICADFNDFACISPRALIEGFAAKKYRHIGRGVGALYFSHGIGAERDAAGHPVKDYGVKYNGLSFGTHASDAHVYLYDKSEELRTQGDKPWIRDTWKNAGLDVRNVWRLEVSIKSKGLTFKDKKSGSTVNLNVQQAYDSSELDKIYHTFVRRLFSFVPNRKGITNITHEFAKNGLQLFDGRPVYDRGTIRNVSSGDRMERILIKNLYQLSDKYRGENMSGARDMAECLAFKLAQSTDLLEWYKIKKTEWEKPIHK